MIEVIGIAAALAIGFILGYQRCIYKFEQMNKSRIVPCSGD